MKNFLFFIFLFFILFQLKGQERKSYNGWYLKPTGQYRLLTLFVNVVYDITPDADPLKNRAQTIWPADTCNSINKFKPDYFLKLLDTAESNRPEGTFTRLFYESSFGNLVLIGDYMVINLKQSAIKLNANTFKWYDLVSKTIDYINETGGLNTIYGHNSISDYDSDGDGKIDVILFIFRNTAGRHGGIKFGQGHMGHFPSQLKLKMGADFYSADIYTSQVANESNIFWKNPTNNLVHEFSHGLFGGNSQHCCGGHHYGGQQIGTFLGPQYGYGLMGGSNSTLVCCNAYERRRLNWIDEKYNPQKFLIAAGGKNADVTKQSGYREFVLRDFITTGDAVRIELPYKDSLAERQFLWLENHKIGQNDKLDFLQYANYDACRDSGNTGIYAYIQVGKNLREGKYRDVFENRADHLTFLNAEGNWDMEVLPDTSVSCIAYGKKPKTKTLYSNPFCGENKLSIIFNSKGTDKLTTSHGIRSFVHEYQDGRVINNVPHLGDNQTAFTDNSVINCCSNPASVNVITYYMYKKGRNTIVPVYGQKNNRSIYLSGLRVDMKKIENDDYLITVRWDDYSVTNDVRWCGRIYLKEKLILKQGNKIVLDQNYTPIQIYKDSISGEFSPVTRFTICPKTKLVLEKKSKLILQNKSELIIASHSAIKFERLSKIIIGAGCKIKISKDATILPRRHIKVEKGGTVEYF